MAAGGGHWLPVGSRQLPEALIDRRKVMQDLHGSSQAPGQARQPHPGARFHMRVRIWTRHVGPYACDWLSRNGSKVHRQ